MKNGDQHFLSIGCSTNMVETSEFWFFGLGWVLNCCLWFGGFCWIMVCLSPSSIPPPFLTFSFTSNLLCSSEKQLICFLSQELWGEKNPFRDIKGHATIRSINGVQSKGQKLYFCTEMNADVLIQNFVNITHPHSTQHPDCFMWSENHERHKLVKMKIHIGTNKFKELHSEEKARCVNRKKSSTQTNKPLALKQQDFSLTSHQPAICKGSELYAFSINIQYNTGRALMFKIHLYTHKPS